MLGDNVACGKESLVLRSPAPDPQHTHEHLPLPCKARGRDTMRAPAYINTHAFIRLAPDLAPEGLDWHSQRLCSSLLHGITAALLWGAVQRRLAQGPSRVPCIEIPNLTKHSHTEKKNLLSFSFSFSSAGFQALLLLMLLPVFSFSFVLSLARLTEFHGG